MIRISSSMCGLFGVVRSPAAGDPGPVPDGRGRGRFPGIRRPAYPAGPDRAPVVPGRTRRATPRVARRVPLKTLVTAA